MRKVSIILLGLASVGIAGCQIEAGSNPSFPPIGSIPQQAVPAPDTFLPTEPSEPTDAEMTASLSSAVDEALAVTETVPDAAPEDHPVATAPLNPNTGEAIASDDGVLNLAEQSQADQVIARDADAAALAAAAAQRVIIAPGEMPAVIAGVNIIAYARSTTNAVGERIIQRPSIRRTNSRVQCGKFDSQDNAQRNFLANGGPQEDPLNLDPDGDGFACRWSPDAYRALILD